MTKEDRIEVIEIITESVKIITSELKNEVVLLRNDYKEGQKAFQKALGKQTDTFLKVLEAYEKRADKHEKNFQDIKKS